MSFLQFAGTTRFELVRRLGAGGMGVVYEAFDRERRAAVAVKTLHSLGPDARLRFKREFRALQDLQHENLVTLGELFCDDAGWFFTMELVRGIDLLRYIRADAAALSPTAVTGRLDEVPRAPATARFDEPRLRGALVQLVRALLALHAAGKVHRDIKPSNILVTPAGRLVVLDFGLVVDQISPTESTEQAVLGTVAYMAPEQAASKPVGPEADWYAVGVTLFEALCGKCPFDGAPIQVLVDKQQREAPRPSQLVPGLPADLDELCAALLRYDPSERPSGAEILRRLGAAPPAAVTSSFTQAAPFIGRSEELAVLRRAFAERSPRAPVALIIEGDSGLGKSALARRFTEELPDAHPGVLVLSGRCYERESMPYKAFDGIIDALGRYLRSSDVADAAMVLPRDVALLGQLFPALLKVPLIVRASRAVVDGGDAHELRRRVFAAFRELFARLTDRVPVVLVIDDLQWADADSVALIEELLRPPDKPPIFLLATMRPGATVFAASKGPDAFEVRTLALTGLRSDDAAELAAVLLQRAAGAHGSRAFVDRIAMDAAGHPLFIDELVRHCAQHPERQPTTMRLEEALWQRAQQLEPATRTLLEVLCIAGQPIRQEVAAAASGLDAIAFNKAAAVLRISNFARTTGTRITDAIEPFHDRVREAIAHALDEATHRLRHEQLAIALEAWDRGEIEPLAVHWRAAGEPVKAAAYAFEAAEQAARALAFDRAARLYQMALALNPPTGEKARAMYLQLANALAHAGRGPEAARAYNLAAEGATAAEMLERRRLAAEQLLRAGHVDEGVTAIRAVLSLVGMSYPESRREALLSIARRRVWLKLRGLGFRERDKSQITAAEMTRVDACWSVAAGLGLVDTVRHFDFQNRHLQLALRAGELTRVIRALCMEMVWAAVGGNDARVAALGERIEPLVARAGDPFSRALLIGCRGIAQTMLGNFREARALLSDAERLLRTQCLNVYSELATIRHFLAAGYGLTGLDTREVLAHLNEARTRGDRHGVASLRSPLVYKMLMDDQPESARRWCLEVLADWSRVGYQLQQFNHLHTMTTIDMYEGKWQDALHNLEANRSNVRRSGLLEVEQIGVWWKLLWGRSALQGACASDGAQRDELFAIVRRSVRGLRRVARPYAQGLAELLEAGLLHARGEERVAVERLRQLDQRFEALGLAAYNGAVQYRLSVLCADAEERQHWARRWPETLARNVVRPERLFETTSPGFVRP